MQVKEKSYIARVVRNAFPPEVFAALRKGVEKLRLIVYVDPVLLGTKTIEGVVASVESQRICDGMYHLLGIRASPNGIVYDYLASDIREIWVGIGNRLEKLLYHR